MLKKLNNRGVAFGLFLYIAGGVGLLLTGRAAVTGQLDLPNFHKERTVDTVENPAPSPWIESKAVFKGGYIYGPEGN